MSSDHIQLCHTSTRSFQILREQNDFFDVTLITDEGDKIEAHKAVLSAFSPLFRNIFQSCPVNQQPFLYLSDVKPDYLNRILDYIYMGEVNVPICEIEQFIKVSSKLKISELSKVKIENPERISGELCN